MAAAVVTHVAVLGAGIMGTSTALFLARRGVRVTLFDAAEQPLSKASRWNEGKIHLGYLYAADPSLETVGRVLPGGLAFKPLVESLIGCEVDPFVSPHDDTFLVHRESVASIDRTAWHVAEVTRLATSHADAGRYLVPLGDARPHRLSRAELDAHCDTAHIVAGFRVPERSISTTWLADRLVQGLAAEPRIEMRLGTRVLGVRRARPDSDTPLQVQTASGADGPYDVVVNALWEGRLAVDQSMGLPAPCTWSHRYRLSVFLRTSRVVDVPSAVVCTGPFGDVKNYNGRDFYVSWYPSGLLVDSSALAPPAPPTLDEPEQARLADEILACLACIIPSVDALRTCIESCRLDGGWVYAAGSGSLADPASTLHRRDRIGIVRSGSYVSVDTGKYSIAPWLASRIAEELVP